MKGDIISWSETPPSVLTDEMNLDPDDGVMKDLNTLFKPMKSNNASNVDMKFMILVHLVIWDQLTILIQRRPLWVQDSRTLFFLKGNFDTFESGRYIPRKKGNKLKELLIGGRYVSSSITVSTIPKKGSRHFFNSDRIKPFFHSCPRREGWNLLGTNQSD